MATISGKRFQITDGASTPTNLFPYTVTEAVYGLSSVIENAKSAVTSVLSAVTLNGVSKAGTTASFYAPTTAGTTGQILKATTSGAPVWTSAALGASNKPIYLNSSGVLTEGVSCLPLTGGTITGTYGALSIKRNNAYGSSIKFENTSSVLGYLGIDYDGKPMYVNSDASATYYLYHSGNSNKSDVAWACSTLTASGNIAANAGITLANDNALGGLDTGGTRRTLLSLDSGNGVYLAWGAAAAGYDTHISGKNVSIRYGTSHAIGIYLNSSANVGIGTATPAYKLDVNGTSGWTTRFISTNSVVYTAHNDGYGFYLGSKQSSSSYYLLNLLYGQTTTGTGGTSALYVRADGRVGIGTTSPGNTLEVNGSATCGASGVAGSLFIRRAYDGNTTYMIGSKGASGADGYTLQITNSSGTGATMTLLNGVLTMGGSIVSTGDQVVSSDLTLKTNLTPVTYSVSDIAKARAVEFDWKDGRGHSMGSIAQDWLGIAPALVHGEEGNMSLAYGQLALVNTILLARQSESHEARIKELEARVAELEMENERLRMN